VGGFVQWSSVLTDESGSYRSSFTATPMQNGFVARAQVVADGYEEYWRDLIRSAGTTFVENFRLNRLVRVSARDSIVFRRMPELSRVGGRGMPDRARERARGRAS